MARGINKVILIGHLGHEPDVRFMDNGGVVATISLATNESWRDKDSGDIQQRTEWHRVVFFKRLAEIAGDYLHKGSQAYIEGSLRTRKWTDTEGVDRYTTEVIAQELQMLGNGSNGSDDGNGKPATAAEQPPAASKQPPAAKVTDKARSSRARKGKTVQKPALAGVDRDDDIPF